MNSMNFVCMAHTLQETVWSDRKDTYGSMEHAKQKFEFPILAQVAVGFVLSVLVLVGISGSIYRLVAPQGWFVQAFGHSLGLGAALAAAVLGAGALVSVVPGWVAPVHRARISDVTVYGFAAAGLLYLGQYLT